MAAISQARTTRPAWLTPTNVMGLGLIALLLVWLVIEFFKSPSQFIQVLSIGLTNGAVYALIALGYTLVYGIIELINFAHGDLFALGSIFGMTMLTGWLGVHKSSPGNWLILLGVGLVTMAFCATLNVTIERLAYRPLRYAPKLAPLITAIGMSFIIQNAAQIWNGAAPKSIDQVVPHGNIINTRGVNVPWATAIVILITIPLLAALVYVVQYTRQGKAMRATAQDADAARLMGIDVNRTIAFTFALGGAMAGAAGVLYAQYTTTTRWDAGFQLGLIAFTSAVLGGIGNLRGAVTGAILIGTIQGLNEGLPDGFGQQWSQSIVFSILILILVFKPEGLLGEVVAEKV